MSRLNRGSIPADSELRSLLQPLDALVDAGGGRDSTDPGTFPATQHLSPVAGSGQGEGFAAWRASAARPTAPPAMVAENLEESEAAVLIQSTFKGFLARKSLGAAAQGSGSGDGCGGAKMPQEKCTAAGKRPRKQIPQVCSVGASQLFRFVTKLESRVSQHVSVTLQRRRPLV